MNRPLLFATLLLLLAAASPAVTHAQEVDTSGTVLPEIAPTEVEILGQLEIDLPPLERQPLFGFNPPPELPPVPAEHRPFVETYKQDTEALAGALPDQDDVPRLRVAPAPMRGGLVGGAGRYFSRFGQAHATQPVSDHEHLSLRIDYEGLSSYAPFDEVDETGAETEVIQTPFDAFEGLIGIETQRERFAAGFDFGGFVDTYTLYGARVEPSLANTYAAQPDREGRGGGGTLWLRTRGELVPADLRLRYDEARYETAREREADPRVRRERRLTLDAEVRPYLAGRRFTAGALVSLAGLADAAPGADEATFDVSLRAPLPSGGAYDLTAGIHVLGYQVSAANRPEADEGRTRIYAFPSLRIDAYPAPDLNVYVQNTPGAEPNALAELFGANPYLIGRPAVQPTLRLVDAEGGAQVTLGPVQLLARGGYRYLPNYQYFEQAELPAYRRGFFAARYEPAHVIHGGVALTLPRYRGLSASLGVNVREGRLLDSETHIPYFAPVTARAMLSAALPEGRGLIQLTGTFESARYVARADDAQVGAFFDLDAEASYRVTPAASVVVRLLNLSDALERWNGYPQPPLIIGTGLRITF